MAQGNPEPEIRPRGTAPENGGETLTITGHANAHSGNVNHDGHVVVTGDVVDGVSIRADGDLNIGGTVHGGRLECGGNAQVHELAGDERTQLVCRGSCRIEAVRGGHVDAGGDIRVATCLHHATVRSGAALLAPWAEARNVSIIAYGGIDIGSVNAAADLRAGVQFVHVDRLADLRQRYDVTREEIAQLTGMLEPLVKRLRRGAGLPPALRDKVPSLTRQLKALRDRKLELAEEMERLRERSVKGGTPRIVVRGELAPGATLTFGPAMLTLAEPVRGPVALTVDGRGQLVRGPVD